MDDIPRSISGGNPFLKISRTLSRLGNTFSGRNRFKPASGTRRRRTGHRRTRQRGSGRRGTRSRGGVKKSPTKRRQSSKVRRGR